MDKGPEYYDTILEPGMVRTINRDDPIPEPRGTVIIRRRVSDGSVAAISDDDYGWKWIIDPEEPEDG